MNTLDYSMRWIFGYTVLFEVERRSIRFEPAFVPRITASYNFDIYSALHVVGQ